MKKLAVILPVLALFVAGVASAHVTVKPAQVGIGAFQTFTVSVPTEKDIPTTSVRLMIPEGLEHVSPTVKPGWTIQLVHAEHQEGEEAMEEEGGDEHADEPIAEIIWTNGNIPASFRDEFTFSAKVPPTETSLTWKAYQTYRDGTVVSWDITSGGEGEGENSGPASVTKVVDDFKEQQAAADTSHLKDMRRDHSSRTSVIVSVLAVIISVFAMFFARRKPQM
jgi:uncharacterized protein YcnI